MGKPETDECGHSEPPAPPLTEIPGTREDPASTAGGNPDNRQPGRTQWSQVTETAPQTPKGLCSTSQGGDGRKLPECPMADTEAQTVWRVHTSARLPASSRTRPGSPAPGCTGPALKRLPSQKNRRCGSAPTEVSAAAPSISTARGQRGQSGQGWGRTATPRALSRWQLQQ